MARNFTRRKFIASSSALLLASQIPGKSQEKSDTTEKLAIDGGPKAVKKGTPKKPRWDAREKQQLEETLQQDTLFYWKGPKTTLLTQRFQEQYPLKHVMPCSSGTAALHIAVAAAGIAPGDEVITTPITDMGTVIGILFQQAVPVFADLDPHTYNLDVADVEKRITPKTKAIIAVHLGGNPADLEELKALAQRHKLILIEDCAQAWGAKFKGKPIGTIGDVACYSLQNSKHITCGDGGIVASNDGRIGPNLQKFGDKGFNRLNPLYVFDVLAPNYRMSELQSAFVAAQLTRVEEIAAKRAQLGDLLTKLISDLPNIATHRVAEGNRCTYWFYMLRVLPDKMSVDRDKFVKALAAEGVPASPGYIPTVLYQMDLFRNHSFFGGRWPLKDMGGTNMDYSKVSCPEAESILKTSLRIVISENMDEDFIRSVAAGIRKVALHFAK